MGPRLIPQTIETREVFDIIERVLPNSTQLKRFLLVYYEDEMRDLGPTDDYDNCVNNLVERENNRQRLPQLVEYLHDYSGGSRPSNLRNEPFGTAKAGRQDGGAQRAQSPDQPPIARRDVTPVPIQDLRKLVRVAQPLIAEDDVARHRKTVQSLMGLIQPLLGLAGGPEEVAQNLQKLESMLVDCGTPSDRYKRSVRQLKESLEAVVQDEALRLEGGTRALELLTEALKSLDQTKSTLDVADEVGRLVRANVSPEDLPERAQEAYSNVLAHTQELAGAFTTVERSTWSIHQTLFEEVKTCVRDLEKVSQ